MFNGVGQGVSLRAKGNTMANLTAFSGSFRNVAEINQRLDEASQHFHLISPATACGALPEGHEVAFSIFKVDPRDFSEGGDTYKPSKRINRVALLKHALDKILINAGGKFDPILTCRIDDGRTPFYCAWRAVAHIKLFDGTHVPVTATYYLDLRDGSPRAEKAAQIGMLQEHRMNIASLCESKARNRAIRTIGIKSTYLPEELEKPFLIVTSTFTGRSENPVYARIYAEMQIKKALGAADDLYGARPAMLMSPQLEVHAAPPVGAALDDDEDPEVVNLPPAAAPTPIVKAVPKLRIGAHKDKPVTQLTEAELGMHATVLRKNLGDPNRAQYAAAYSKELDIVLAEQTRRGVDSEQPKLAANSDF